MAHHIARALCALGVGACAAAVSAQTVYSHDFENGLAPGFNSGLIGQTPIAGRRFLGRFGNDSVTLSLTGLPSGSYRVDFDFYGIGTWDGNQAPGPDSFVVLHDLSTELLRTTFAIGSVDTRLGVQSYPGDGQSLLGGYWPGRSGAVENNTLGYYAGVYARDAVWRLSADFDVEGDTARITFRGEGLQALSDESWGIDNVHVERVIPAPGGLLAAIGACAIAGGRRRRRSR
ncbi:MAG: hypothetical protein ACOYN0_06855 [Phycisphaerales bacterium]